VALVAGLLAKRPGDRPPTAEAVVRALEGDATPAGGTTWPRGAGRGRPLRLAAAGVLAGGLVTVLVVAGALARARRARPAGAAAGEVVRPGARLVDQRVAVAPFVNQTGDSALGPLGRLTSDWIAQGLAEAGFAEVVDPETIRWTWQRAPNARALANATGARLVVTGAYYVEGDSVRLLARIGDAADDRVLRALAPVSGPVAAPRQAVARLRERVLGALGGLLDASPDAWAAASELPPSLAAYRHFSAGHEHFARDAFQDATREYLAAHRLDSTFVAPVVWAGLSRYLTGAPATADSLFRVADRARARLAPADRYLLAALWAEARGDFAGALRAAREMARVAPTSTGALLSVGWQATRVNRPAEAVAALVRLDPERPDVRRYPGYWHVLTEAYHLLGDYRAELAAAQRGRGQHPDRLTTLYNEARALSALGRIEDVGGRLDEASELAEDPGFRAVEVIEAIGGELRTHGHAAAAEAAFARALRWYDGRPAGERAAPTFRARHAEALYLAGRWEEARRIVEQLVPLPSATWHYGGYLGVMPGTPVDDVNRRGYVGVLAARRGDRAAALAADSALSALRRPYLAGRHTYWRARIAALLGDRERAVTLLQDALREGQIYSVLHGQADLASLHGFPAFEELVRRAGDGAPGAAARARDCHFDVFAPFLVSRPGSSDQNGPRVAKQRPSHGGRRS
jgi:tetratricopeptide (TPR) repeat protein